MCGQWVKIDFPVLVGTLFLDCIFNRSYIPMPSDAFGCDTFGSQSTPTLLPPELLAYCIREIVQLTSLIKHVGAGYYDAPTVSARHTYQGLTEA